MKKTVIFTALLGLIASQVQAADTANFTFHGLITRSTCTVKPSGDKHVQMVTKNAEDFSTAEEIDGQGMQDLDFTCPKNLIIKVTITDKTMPLPPGTPTTRNYLVNKTGTCNIAASGTANNKACATGVGVVPRIFSGSDEVSGSGGNLQTEIVLGRAQGASPSDADYYADAPRQYKVKGFYKKTGTANPTPGGVEAKALFTFSYQ